MPSEFIVRQSGMNAAFVEELTQKFLNFRMPFIGAIVAGIDPTGAHIYVVEDDDVSCWNTIGFAAIRSGARHAESQLMLARHSWTAPAPETLILTYIAKKRSEVSPGIGEETDMFVLGPGMGTYSLVTAEHMRKLDLEYQKILRSETKALNRAKAEVTAYIEELTRGHVGRAQEDRRFQGWDRVGFNHRKVGQMVM